jgi:diadenosine tetraphosphate (Ap4A) HIT family hydrolase
MFNLHERLEKDLINLGKLPLSYLMLMPDSDNPWVVLVPRIENIRELHQLTTEQQHQLLEEINTVSKHMEAEFSPDKMNIGALGNMVPQLHIHIICRFKDDKAWPGAIWGSEQGRDQARIENFKNILCELLH